MRHGWILVLAAAVLPAFALAAPPDKRPTEPFRREHVQIRKQLDAVSRDVGALATTPGPEQRKLMTSVVGFFKEHIKPHAAWEERVLYPAVDKYAGGGPNRFTATMRYEHRIVERWIAELERESRKPEPDARAFTRRADNLLGLIRAHFEEEEEVLLPILDRTMTPDQFRREIMHPPSEGHE